MKVEIVVSRNGLPKVGETKDYPDGYALGLIEKGLAKLVVDIKIKDSKPKKDK
jgi:hypothetical protein